MRKESKKCLCCLFFLAPQRRPPFYFSFFAAAAIGKREVFSLSLSHGVRARVFNLSTINNVWGSKDQSESVFFYVFFSRLGRVFFFFFSRCQPEEEFSLSLSLSLFSTLGGLGTEFKTTTRRTVSKKKREDEMKRQNCVREKEKYAFFSFLLFF